jgi:hypothetical protein
VIEVGHHLAHRCRQTETVVDQIIEMGLPAFVVQGHATAHQAADHAMGLDGRRHQVVLLHQVRHGGVFQGVVLLIEDPLKVQANMQNLWPRS